jgi:hypothetical protein
MAKAKRGRPSLTGETGERFQVHLPPKVAKTLKSVGGKSLSQGIIRAAYRVPPKEADPKARYVVVKDPEEIAAIKRCNLTDPIGGCIDGVWFAEAYSLEQYRNRNAEAEE